MSSILVSPDSRSKSASSPATSSLLSRFLRQRVLNRLAKLASGALRIRDPLGEVLVGDADGAFGVHRLEIRNLAFYRAVAVSGSVGAGESYVAGDWQTEDLVAVLRLMVRDRDVLIGLGNSIWSGPRRLLLRLGHGLRRNSRAGSQRNIADHYDLSDELFARFLDPSMTYSSAWFANPEQTLEAAQLEKRRRLCRLVDLEPGERLLEIGSGWGSLALTAASEFGASVTTTTISRNQFVEASRRVESAGLAGRVTVLKKDYRDVEGTFDKVLSCEMIEAVGAAYLPEFLRRCASRLRPGGVLGLQAITIADQHYESALRSVDYIKRHVFPGSFIPSVTAITSAATKHTDLRLVRLHEFGEHYAETLLRWRRALCGGGDGAGRFGRDEQLLRAWTFYFAYCEAGFRERHIGVCHLRFERV